MSAQPYHKRYHSDALAGVMSLTLEERGAYQTILDLIYDRGGPILDNERLLAGYLNCSVRKWRSIRSTLIEKGKIYLSADGKIANRRADFELENYAKTSRKHAENGSSGGRTKAENVRKAAENRDLGLAELENNSTISESRNQNVSKDTGKSPDLAKAVFDLGVEVLQAKGTSERQARSFLGKLRGSHSDGKIMDALQACQSENVVDPIPWLTARLKRPSLSVISAEPDRLAYIKHVHRKYGA